MDGGKYLGDAVYGALDGIVTTFAIVAGVVGASLSANVILILGFANLIADGISMAAGNYLAKKSEQGFRDQRRQDELDAIEQDPQGQRKDVENIYRVKGFKQPLLEKVVTVITRDKKRWADEMLVGELGLFDQGTSPVKAGLTTFVAFLLAGAVPLLSYVIASIWPEAMSHAFVLAIVLTGLVLFLVGSLRSLLIAKHWLQAGVEMLVIGGFAAGAAYVVGYLLKGFVV